MDLHKNNLLQIYNAYWNCIRSNNTLWQEKHIEKTEALLLEALPHGSGIDCDWHFDFSKEKQIVCSNSYHRMNDVGYYCGYIDFSIIIKADHRDIFGKLDFRITGNFGKNQDIKDYLEDTIAYCLDDCKSL